MTGSYQEDLDRDYPDTKSATWGYYLNPFVNTLIAQLKAAQAELATVAAAQERAKQPAEAPY